MERGAAYAKEYNLSGGDPCGRYAWDQGPLPESKTHFPRDYVLVALSGDLTDLGDVGGPVAAADDIDSRYIRLNNDRKEDVGLVAGGGVDLEHGEVFGSAHYGTYFSHSGVTFVDYPAPSIPSYPIDFAAASARLVHMSDALLDYDSQPAQKAYSTLRFSGTDPELNVFSVTPEQLENTYSYEYDVPEGASVIVNILGSAPVIQWSGISGTYSPSKILWNFPEATSLLMQGVGFRGSILAPWADATLRWGSHRGTAVVASAAANSEFYYEPYQVPAPAGCLDYDPTWSCSADTMTDAAGKARVAPEAGFLELAAQEYIAEDEDRISARHRIWYSFRPARTYPKTRPLIVFFNGGPGGGTSAFLFSFNTGPFTLDPKRTGLNDVVVNRGADWSELGNLLYIDAPATGFSYPLEDSLCGSTNRCSIGTDMDRDAGMFVQVILRFLARHPDLQSNRVILVSESYGGARSILMLRHLLNYPSLIADTSPYQDDQLHTDLMDHFVTVFGHQTPTFQQIVDQFGHQVLTSPIVAGGKQRSYGFDLPPHCDSGCGSSTCDVYNCDWVPSTRSDEDETIGTRLTTVSTLETMLGVNPRSIAWMYGDNNEGYENAREDAYGRNQAVSGWPIPPADDMEDLFGTLETEDRYFVPLNKLVNDPYNDGTSVANSWSSTERSQDCARWFVFDVHHGVETLIADGLYDTVLGATTIPKALDAYANDGVSTVSEWIESATYDENHNEFGLSTPATMWLEYRAVHGGGIVPVAMPGYQAGHTVVRRDPIDLFRDVEVWYYETR